ncbi:MAG TPA: peptidylprolyl isomerase [Longimicrobiales bacterium]|nr:peptidylprolyl isomerase [Longimicrobiales bacterium]
MTNRRAKTLPVLLVSLAFFAGCGGEGGAGGGGTPAGSPLLDPTSAAMTATAPDSYRVRFETTAGDFVVEVRRALSPNGADRFYNLVRNGYYEGVRFFRVIDGFMAQFGMHGDPQVTAAWRAAPIQDDPVAASNARGTVTFAMTGQPNSRTTQVFINYRDNSNLDAMGFAPFGEVVEGMDVIDQLHSGYGEGAPNGSGPSQAQIQAQGNEYLASEFPELDYIERATILEG